MTIEKFVYVFIYIYNDQRGRSCHTKTGSTIVLRMWIRNLNMIGIRKEKFIFSNLDTIGYHLLVEPWYEIT
jgi:hypothetical protein